MIYDSYDISVEIRTTIVKTAQSSSVRQSSPTLSSVLLLSYVKTWRKMLWIESMERAWCYLLEKKIRPLSAKPVRKVLFLAAGKTITVWFCSKRSAKNLPETCFQFCTQISGIPRAWWRLNAKRCVGLVDLQQTLPCHPKSVGVLETATENQRIVKACFESEKACCQGWYAGVPLNDHKKDSLNCYFPSQWGPGEGLFRLLQSYWSYERKKIIA